MYDTNTTPQPTAEAMKLKDGKCPTCGSQKFLVTESTCWKATSDIPETPSYRDDHNYDMEAYSVYENNIDCISCHTCGQEIEQEGLEVNFS